MVKFLNQSYFLSEITNLGLVFFHLYHFDVVSICFIRNIRVLTMSKHLITKIVKIRTSISISKYCSYIFSKHYHCNMAIFFPSISSKVLRSFAA